jgi:hypothetical protein
MLTPDTSQALPSTGEPPAPPAAPAADPYAEQIVPLTEEERGQWTTRISRARLAQKDWHKVWEANLDAYQPKPADLTRDADRYDTNPNIDFRQVEQKKSALYYENPDIVLEPQEPLATELNAGQVVTLRQAVLNKLLGPKPDGVDLLTTVHRALNDILCIGGIGWTKIGWRVETVEVPPDAETLAAGGPPYPLRVPIYERPFWDYFPLKEGLIPHDATGFVPDEWDFVGRDFAMPLTQGVREFKLPEDFEPQDRSSRATLRKGKHANEQSVPQITGTEIHYYRSRFNADVVHPEVVYELVLIDGLERPARHRPCPYQTLGPDGRLTDDSVTGYLLHPLGIRHPAEGAYAISDSGMTRPLVDELKVYRGQNLMQRDASRPVILFKEDAISAEQRDVLKQNGYHHLIPIAPEEWPAGTVPFMAVALPTQSRDSYEGQQIIERDIERTLGIGANQTGVMSTGRRSATEAAAANGSTDTLMATYQGRLMSGIVSGVRKLDALWQRQAKGKQMYVKIVGPTGAQTLEAVDPAMTPGRMMYKIRPDSQLRVNAEQDRAQFLQGYNFLAPSPNVNRFELDTLAARKFGMDPAKVVVQPQPPPPPPPKISISISMADLLTPARPVAAKLLMNQPLTPDDFSIVEDLLKEAAILPVDAQGDALPVAGGASTEPAPQGQPEHPGPAEKAEQLDAHQVRRTGGIEGVGTV